MTNKFEQKYINLFTEYVKSLPLNQDDKNFITSKDFINDNPSFYLFYPMLFSEYFDVPENKLNLLCIAGYFYYQSTMFLDEVVDEKKLNQLFPMKY
jgi:hypothetical protein